MKFAAFISYSSKDAAFARRLHRRLEAYRIPTEVGRFQLSDTAHFNRLFPIFRDREELPSGDLSGALQSALANSGALIVVCSPDAASSKWVNKEVETFIAAGRASQIFAIVTDSAEARDGPPSQFFPPALKQLSSSETEHLAADAGRDGFEAAMLKLVGGMIGVNVGALRDREAKRKRQRIFRTIALGAVVVAAIAGAFATQRIWQSMLHAELNFRRYILSDRALSAQRPLSVFQDCAPGAVDCPNMVILPEAQFRMGSDEAEPNAEAQEHPVRLLSTPRFAVSRDEVTFANWDACVRGGGCDGYLPDASGFDRLNEGVFETIGRWSQMSTEQGAEEQAPTPRAALPVMNVSWDQAQSYVRWLSRMTGKRYRLLTEAEWEYAARGGEIGQYSWGNDEPTCDAAVASGASFARCGRTRGPSPVASFRPNPFGLHDVHGNVAEWVEDCYHEYFEELQDTRAVRDTDLDFCPYRVVRGGSWYDERQPLRSAARRAYARSTSANDRGFRVARDLETTNRNR